MGSETDAACHAICATRTFAKFPMPGGPGGCAGRQPLVSSTYRVLAMLDVFVDRRSNFLRRGDYVLHRMLRGLQRTGLPWRILDRQGSANSADVAFVHVDLTDLPPEFLGIGGRYDQTINGKAVTIDRRRYSRLRLMPGDTCNGPVIVKTVRNSRGFPELRYDSRRNIWTRVAHVACKLTVPGYKEGKCPRYEVYDSVAEVPAAVWGDSRLLVERFAPGTLELPLVRYKYNFFLDVEQNTRSTFSTLIYHDGSVEKFEVVEEVPAEVRRIREALNLDYGAIEYFVVDDDCFVVDVNKTVTQPVAWTNRFPPSGKFIDDITARLTELVKAGRV